MKIRSIEDIIRCQRGWPIETPCMLTGWGRGLGTAWGRNNTGIGEGIGSEGGSSNFIGWSSAQAEEKELI